MNTSWRIPIVTSSTIDIFFEITKFSKILSKFTFISNILSKFDKIFENFRKKCQFRKYFRKFCIFEKNVNGRWSHYNIGNLVIWNLKVPFCKDVCGNSDRICWKSLTLSLACSFGHIGNESTIKVCIILANSVKVIHCW